VGVGLRELGHQAMVRGGGLHKLELAAGQGVEEQRLDPDAGLQAGRRLIETVPSSSSEAMCRSLPRTGRTMHGESDSTRMAG
jgi:hypothetical protein